MRRSPWLATTLLAIALLAGCTGTEPPAPAAEAPPDKPEVGYDVLAIADGKVLVVDPVSGGGETVAEAPGTDWGSFAEWSEQASALVFESLSDGALSLRALTPPADTKVAEDVAETFDLAGTRLTYGTTKGLWVYDAASGETRQVTIATAGDAVASADGDGVAWTRIIGEGQEELRFNDGSADKLAFKGMLLDVLHVGAVVLFGEHSAGGDETLDVRSWDPATGTMRDVVKDVRVLDIDEDGRMAVWDGAVLAVVAPDGTRLAAAEVASASPLGLNARLVPGRDAAVYSISTPAGDDLLGLLEGETATTVAETKGEGMREIAVAPDGSVAFCVLHTGTGSPGEDRLAAFGLKTGERRMLLAEPFGSINIVAVTDNAFDLKK